MREKLLYTASVFIYTFILNKLVAINFLLPRRGSKKEIKYAYIDYTRLEEMRNNGHDFWGQIDF